VVRLFIVTLSVGLHWRWQVVPTIEAAYNVDVTFFETDGRTTNRFSIMAKGGLAYNTFTGDTNYVGKPDATGSPERRPWL
jgi:hypothetical protein